METELISVLVTVRDGEPFIDQAIASLLAQTDPHFEVIVVDDGSSDQTPAILSRYADPRLKVILLSPQGRVPALREAVRHAGGQLLAVLDADDVSLPQRLAVQRAYLNAHPDVALVGAQAIVFGAGTEMVSESPVGPATVRRALGMYNPFFFSSLMFRRSVYEQVGGFPLEDGWRHDLAFLHRVARFFPVDILPVPLIRYRQHAEQIPPVFTGKGTSGLKRPGSSLRAAWTLGLPWYLWIFPVLGWLYASIPAPLRPRSLKQPIKSFLLRFFRILQRPSGT